MKRSAIFLMAGLLVLGSLFVSAAAADLQGVGLETRNSMTVSQGATITVTLSENPSTGYSWVMNATSGLKLVDDTYTKLENDRFGAEGQHEWVYLAAAPGLQEVRGEYKRPFEEGVARNYLLTVLVVEKPDSGSGYIYIPPTSVPTVTPTVTPTPVSPSFQDHGSSAAELIKKFQSNEKKITFPVMRPSTWPFIIFHT
ncbi:putative secreted protein [Methanolinea mesophila]|uniref:protease inhibitor I42 family protein n=1 Tax=Methanolinea mesophila TaxID=547055 RepID=UPI001AE377B4|nr:protease inhibitor I42 family protein [Methanolinea mesophila]MBP1929371.1 putative secreted protein [Methanolinea mesophila]